jgi:hypothetical protein
MYSLCSLVQAFCRKYDATWKLNVKKNQLRAAKNERQRKESVSAGEL